MKNIKIKKGFSLIELILTFAMLITLILGIFFVYKKVKVDSDVREIITNLSIVTNNYKSLTANKNTPMVSDNGETYSSSFYDYMVKDVYKKLPQSIDGKNPAYVNKTGEVSLDYNKNYLDIVLIVNIDVCEKLATQLLSSGNYVVNANRPGWQDYYISKENPYYANLVSNMKDAGFNYSDKYSVSDITKACHTNADADPDPEDDQPTSVSRLNVLYLG